MEKAQDSTKRYCRGWNVLVEALENIYCGRKDHKFCTEALAGITKRLALLSNNVKQPNFAAKWSKTE